MSGRTIGLCLTMLCGAVRVGLAQPTLAVVGGRIQAFGDVYCGSNVVHSVTLKNTGTHTLKITKVAASCGCTAALVSSHDVAPSDSTLLTITFNSSGYLGSIEKTVRVTSNDPVVPIAAISFTVNVINLLQWRPPVLFFDEARTGSPQTKVVHITNTSTSTVRILKITPRDSLLSVKIHLKPFPEILKPGEKADLFATLTAERPGWMAGQIDIETDSKVQPSMFIRFSAHVIH